ncbi:MAG: MogA/MoaB family molybdenum cofactor biosynthesis protein [Nitrososphaeria archaeon]
MSEFTDMYYFGIITVSTSRFYSEKAVDESGLLASAIIRNSGYKVCCRSLVPDDKLAITGSLTSMLFNFKPDVILLIGGTGPSKTDFTDEIVSKLSEKLLFGVSEEFRRRSYQKIGPRGLLGNMSVGLINDSVIVSLPGSPDAVEEGLKVFMEILPHIMEVRRGKTHDKGNNVG